MIHKHQPIYKWIGLQQVICLLPLVCSHTERQGAASFINVSARRFLVKSDARAPNPFAFHHDRTYHRREQLRAADSSSSDSQYGEQLIRPLLFTGPLFLFSNTYLPLSFFHVRSARLQKLVELLVFVTFSVVALKR